MPPETETETNETETADEPIMEWSHVEDGILYEVHAYDDGCHVLAISANEDDEETVTVIAAGLTELDATISFLTRARNALAALPIAQQGIPDFGDDEDDET